MKNKQQLKSAVLLLLALSLLAIYVYSKKQPQQSKSVEGTKSVQTNVVETNIPTVDSTGTNQTQAPKSPSAGGIPAPKTNQ
jgi:apolipoprotein N-acyltransferase